MKKKAVFTLAACSIAVLFLLAVLAVGLASDGFGLKPLIQESEAGRALGKADGQYRYEYTWDPAESEVTGLEVEWVNGTVELKVGSTEKILITERAGWELKDREKLELSRSGGTLKIKWKDEIFSFGLFQNKYKDLVVEVPEAVAENLQELFCSTASGDITAEGFHAEEAGFSTASGDLRLTGLSGGEAALSTASGDISLGNVALTGELSVSTTSGALDSAGVTAEETELSTVSGELAFSGNTGELHASTVSAQVRAELSQCPETAEMDSVSGDLVLAVPENEGFEVEYDSVSGGFSSDFPVTGGTGKSDHALYGNGKAKFDFSTTSGNMRVEKLP